MYLGALREYLIDRSLSDKRLNASYFGYKLIIDRKGYQIFRRPFLGNRVVAVNNDVAVLLEKHSHKERLVIYENYGSPFFTHTVEASRKHFPSLLPDSKIAFCMVLPYLRNSNGTGPVSAWRLVVVTDKGQIYHNFPNRDKRFDGETKSGDMVRFEESAVWDLPGRKYPTPSANCDETERYFPCLPAETYLYHPMLNTDKGYRDEFHNGGFGKSTTVYENGAARKVSRFYVPRRDFQANSFLPMGGYEPDSKMTLLGTYESNSDCGVRTAIFATSDGGRNWFCKYEFGDLGEYGFRQGVNKGWGRNFGNGIDTHAVKGEYIPNSLILRKRSVIVPSASRKEPAKKFEWGGAVEIREIAAGKETIITTATPHNLETGNIIAIQNRATETPRSSDWQWATNDDVSPTSAGNGLLFKVDVLDDRSVRLFEYVASPDNNIACRHIHHVNRVKDGWIIGTGEVYPNGWLLYMQMKEADTYSPKSASESFRIVRLNSSENSVQRTLGCILHDDSESTIMFASDADTLQGRNIKMPQGRGETLSRGSTGVFVGQLSDIDDFSKFKTVYEAKEPAYFFKQLGDAIVFCGQRGELAISLDGGKNWHEDSIRRPLLHYYGRSYSYFVTDDFIVRIK